MKQLKIFILSLISAALLFSTNHRLVILALATANLASLVNQAAAYDPPPPRPPRPPRQQAADATQQTVSPSFTLMDASSSMMFSSFMAAPSIIQRGLQFKNPVVSPGLSWRSYNDDEEGGFGGNEFGGDVGFDVDVYDGLISGFVYQHLYRGGENDLATSEHLQSDGVSFYAAKRFFDLLNVGLAYNFAVTDHKLTRATTMNLDRDSNGFTMLSGISGRIKKFSLNTTTSFGYVNDDYNEQNDLETGRFSWGGGLNYDISKWITAGGAFTYNRFIFQDTFPDSSVRDTDYWMVGPRIQIFPMDNLTINLQFDTMEGYKNYSSYVARIGVDISF